MLWLGKDRSVSRVALGQKYYFLDSVAFGGTCPFLGANIQGIGYNNGG